MLRVVQGRASGANRAQLLPPSHAHTLRRNLGLGSWLKAIFTGTEDSKIQLPHLVPAPPRDPSYKKVPQPPPTHSVPMETVFPGTPSNHALEVERTLHSQAGPITQITTLKNGLRVATEKNFGQASAFALFVECGGIYEDASTYCISHLIERMAFKVQEHAMYISSLYCRERRTGAPKNWFKNWNSWVAM